MYGSYRLHHRWIPLVRHIGHLLVWHLTVRLLIVAGVRVIAFSAALSAGIFAAFALAFSFATVVHGEA
jgi:hypothetical protein